MPKLNNVSNSNLTVMIWIHGGAWTMNSNGNEFFNGTNLAKSKQIIVIGINYRLGLLGFPSNSEIINNYNGGKGYGGMIGIYDAVIALKWVYTNIK